MAGLLVPVQLLGVPDSILGQGPRAILLARLGLTPEAVANTVLTQLPVSAPGDQFPLPVPFEDCARHDLARLPRKERKKPN